jgi:elongation factor G
VLEVSPGDGRDHLPEGLAFLPARFRGAVRTGVRSAEQGGCGLGYPCYDVGVRAVDFTVHPKDSTEAAFEAAAAQAYANAFDKAGAVLLEPVMTVAVQTPEEFLGSVLGDLQRRRAVIEAIESPAAGVRSIRGVVALAEMFGYSTSLRSVSQGRAVFTMEPRAYAPVPPERAKGIVL